MIGDAVNLGARIESACKAYSAKLLISESTYRKLKGTYRVREVDFVQVKGKTQPVAIYEVLDAYDEDDFPNVMDVVNHFTNGLHHYRKQNWDRALEAFERVLAFHSGDNLSKTYIDRCNILEKSDLPKDWDGVWVMKTK